MAYGAFKDLKRRTASDEVLRDKAFNIAKNPKYNGYYMSLCVIDIFSKYVWVVPLKDKKDVSIVNAFQKTLNDSNRKPNKIWVEKGSEFYNNSFKKWLRDNDIEMYLIHHEGKSVVAERFIRTLKTKIYKYMT